MRISEKKYLKALKIVKSYKAQIELEIELATKKEKLLNDVVKGDFIEPIILNKTNQKNWTLGKKYEVIGITGMEYGAIYKKLRVKCDTGKIIPIRVYYLGRNHFRRKVEDTELNPKWKVVN